MRLFRTNSLHENLLLDILLPFRVLTIHFCFLQLKDFQTSQCLLATLLIQTTLIQEHSACVQEPFNVQNLLLEEKCDDISQP